MTPKQMSAWCLLRALARTWVVQELAAMSAAVRPEMSGWWWGQLNERLSFTEQPWLNAGLILLTCSVVG